MTADDYKKIMYTMFPPGPLWPRQEGDAAVWDTWISAIAQEAARVDSAAQEIVLEAIPDATNYTYPSELLTKWEDLAGLDGTGTDTERVQALIAQLRRRGNPTLALFAGVAGELDDDVVAIDNYRLVDSIDLPWDETATANVNYDTQSDPDGGTDADEVELPATSDAIDADILRIANYESIYVSFRVKLAGAPTSYAVDVELLGRDGASKYSDTLVIDNTWRRYDFTVADVGTGGSDPNLSLTLTSGTGVTLHLYDVKAGWREKHFPQLVAGGLCGHPSAPGWEYVWGLEYGEDLTDRDVGGNPDWSATGSGSITDNYANDPISRNQLADRLYIVVTGSTFTVPLTVDQDETIRISFLYKGLITSPINISIDGYSGIIYSTGVFWTDTQWTKFEYVGNVGTGGGTPQINIIVQAGYVCDIVTAHMRVSVVNETLESQIEDGSPLHVTPVFLSYGELSEAGE